MLEHGSLNDVQIKLSDGEIVANKDILMARSDYFATMFKSNSFIEGETNLVDMSHCSKTVMEKIIKFFFTGEGKFGNLSLDQLSELCYMSEMMLLEKFQAEVKDYIKMVIAKTKLAVSISDYSLQNDAIELIWCLQLADHYNFKKMKTRILGTIYFFLLKRIPVDADGLDSFKALPFNLIKDIFLLGKNVVILNGVNGPPFDPPTAIQVLQAFMVWLSENEATEEQKSEIVDSFNFEEFTLEELITSVWDSGLYPTKRIDERVLKLFKIY